MRFSRPASFSAAPHFPLLWFLVYGAVLGLWGVFMVCGVSSQPALSATLPAVLTQMPEAGAWQTVFLGEGGRVSLNRTEMDLLELGRRIRRLDPERRQVLFVVDPGVAFRDVARVWRLCREAGATQITIATLREAP
jgi:biopolymer transport protein ExbD